VLKRMLDLALGTVALAVGSPVIAATAVVTRALDGPPVFFRQQRSGRGGRPFTMIKFRTMRPPLPHEVGPEFDAARLTRLGDFLRRTSLDELPTFLHVVRGEMSLVGPRPLPVAYLARYDDTQARRLEVRPGVTGLAQVSGRNALTWEDKLALDVRYVDTHTLLLDLRILARTIGTVLRRSGIDHGVGVTMTEFTGQPA